MRTTKSLPLILEHQPLVRCLMVNELKDYVVDVRRQRVRVKTWRRARCRRAGREDRHRRPDRRDPALTLRFLPALYAAWFRVKRPAQTKTA